MDNTINLNKEIFSKNQYERVIDTSFTQLIFPVTSSNIPPQISIQEFFDDYQSIFFLIPKFGDINSHEYLVKTSGEYINFNQTDESIQALIDEITQLRQENLQFQQQILNLQTPNK